jgi:hypothetical protein
MLHVLDVFSKPSFLPEKHKKLVTIKDLGLPFLAICFDLYHMVLLHIRK